MGLHESEKRFYQFQVEGVRGRVNWSNYNFSSSDDMELPCRRDGDFLARIGAHAGQNR